LKAAWRVCEPIAIVVTCILAIVAIVFTSIDYSQSTSLSFCGIDQRMDEAANDNSHRHHETDNFRLHTNEWLYDATFTLRPPGRSNR
jgi:hypothetical protein